MKKILLLATLLTLTSTLLEMKADDYATLHEEKIQNPMLWADVPDPDVIRVDDTFYMVSTTMHLMPGAPIMASKDLKNWETIGYIFDKLTDSPNINQIITTSILKPPNILGFTPLTTPCEDRIRFSMFPKIISHIKGKYSSNIFFSPYNFCIIIAN